MGAPVDLLRASGKEPVLKEGMETAEVVGVRGEETALETVASVALAEALEDVVARVMGMVREVMEMAGEAKGKAVEMGRVREAVGTAGETVVGTAGEAAVGTAGEAGRMVGEGSGTAGEGSGTAGGGSGAAKKGEGTVGAKLRRQRKPDPPCQ